MSVIVRLSGNSEREVQETITRLEQVGLILIQEPRLIEVDTEQRWMFSNHWVAEMKAPDKQGEM